MSSVYQDTGNSPKRLNHNLIRSFNYLHFVSEISCFLLHFVREKKKRVLNTAVPVSSAELCGGGNQ